MAAAPFTVAGARRRGGSTGEVGEELLDALVDVVADGADLVRALAGRVVEGPVDVRLPGKYGHSSPQPMVMTTSLAATVSR